jgi:hypothetical protein
MDTFLLVNWGLCLLTSALLSWTALRDRALLVKPSVLVVVFFHVMIQWAATIEAGVIYDSLPSPYTFVLLAHGFPIATLVGSFCFLRRDARDVLRRLGAAVPDGATLMGTALLAGSGVIVIVAAYLYSIGFADTGLYAVLVQAPDAIQVREDSLKLLTSSVLRYGFQLMATTLAPMSAVALTLWAFRGPKATLPLRLGVAATGVFIALFGVSLTGARGHGAQLVLALVLCWFFRRGAPFVPVRFAAAAVLVLTLPVGFSILRDGQTFTAFNLERYYGGLVDRTFKGPMWVGYSYVHFAQTDRFFGPGAIPKLADFLDVPVENAANIIGLEYGASRLETVHANGSFVFTYYSYFGLWVFPLCCMAVWALDLALLAYRRVRDEGLMVTVPAIAACVQNLASTEYTTLLVTHGFLPILATAVIASRIFRGNRGRRIDPTSVRAGAAVPSRSSGQAGQWRAAVISAERPGTRSRPLIS